MDKQRNHNPPRRRQCALSYTMFHTFLITYLVSLLILPSHGFFFPKSFFQRSPETPPPFQQPQQHPRGNSQFFGGEQLQGSGTDIQPAIRIVNRPPPPRNNDQQQEASGPPPGSGFHVPRELCLACEKFPWMPVAGGERPTHSVAAASTFSQAQAQPNPKPFSSSEQQPTKTIVINALGEAQMPVPLPPAIPNRRPFAIQFDGNNIGNQVNYQEPRKPHQPPTAPGPVQDNQQNLNRPVSFQIFQAQNSKPSVLQQVNQNADIVGMEPPPIRQEYGQPTILHQQTVPPKQPVGEKPQVQNQGNLPPPPNPLTVGTIIASQQNNGRIPDFQKVQPAKLVYQEHFTSQSVASPQNFKVPIISQQHANIPDMKPPPPPNGYNNSPPPPNGYNNPPPPNGYNNQPPPGYNNIVAHSIPQPQHVGPPPQQGIFLQMRPPMPFNMQPLPRPSQSMKPPGPMIHYGKPVHIPNNIGPQRPSGQIMFPPPQAFLQMTPPSPPRENQIVPQPNIQYGPNPNTNGIVNGNHLQEERRPSPSGHVLNVQLPNNNVQTNSIQPVPIPVPTQQQNPNNNRPNTQEPTFTQEQGWEIIPSIQTDLTHLFAAPGKNAEQQKELPVPVPIPVPQSHPPKSPLFIVTGSNQQQDNTQIKVQDVSYHEEANNRPSSPSNIVSSSNQVIQQQPPAQNINSTSENQVIPNGHQVQINYGGNRPPPPPQQFFRPRPFILGVPPGPPMNQVMFRPQLAQQFQPALSPSIMTDLNHAQQTSLLTHQYLSQANGVQPLRESAFFVRPVVSAILNQQLHQPHIANVAQEPNNLLQESVEQTRVQETHSRIPSSNPGSQEYSHNCQGSQQQVLDNLKVQQATQQNQVRHEADDVSQTQENQVAPTGSDVNEVDSSQTFNSASSHHTRGNFVEPTSNSVSPPEIRGSVNVQDNGNKGSYFLYYPRPVSKNPVYWVQPSRTVTQGVVRLSPQLTPMPPSIASSMVSWSRPRVVVANQFRTDYSGIAHNQGEEAQGSFNKEEVNSGRHEPVEPEQNLSNEEYIPYGQKLGVNRDKENRTPFDIISVSGSDEIQQNLEDTNDDTSNPQNGDEDDSQFTSASSDDSTTKYASSNIAPTGEYNEENEEEPESEVVSQNINQANNNLNNFEHDDSDDERDDFGLRPQTTFRKPISTTVIHSPGVSSFQSMKLPNFKPHRVIVHDFTSHSAKAVSSGPSSFSSSDNSESQSQVSSSKTPSNIWEEGGRIKAPKYVENDEDEDSSESINRPQGLNIQEVIASGPVQTADCVTTAHTSHALASFSSTVSPRVTEFHGVSSSKGREIYFPLGTRFPAGRPSLFGRPLSSIPVTISTTSTLSPTTVAGGGNREQQTPSGFAASIPVPVYRRPISITHDSHESQATDETGTAVNQANTVTYIRPQANVLVAEDIYKESEIREENDVKNTSFTVEGTTSPTSSTESETINPDSVMSTEKSSSFSVSVADDKTGSWRYVSNQGERVEGVDGNDLKQGGDGKSRKMKVVHVTSVPVVTEAEPTTTASSDGASTTVIPQPASTSTKIVKTVRVRQRMRSGSFNGPLRNRFHGPGRVRVVHRPATQEYIRHFPEFATQEGDKLAKEEEQEVKNALIELKKSPESIKTH